MPGCKLFAHVWMPEDPRTHTTRVHSGAALLPLTQQQQQHQVEDVNLDADLGVVIGSPEFGL